MFIKIPTHEVLSQHLSPTCILTASRQEVECRRVTLWERRRWIGLLSSTPLATLALLECIATLRGHALSCYVLSIPIGMTQVLEPLLRRLCVTPFRAWVPISFEAYRQLTKRRSAVTYLKVTAVGGCGLLVVVVTGSPPPLVGGAVVLLALALWGVERWLLTGGIYLHRRQADAITIAIPDSLTCDAVSPCPEMPFSASTPAPNRPLFESAPVARATVEKPS